MKTVLITGANRGIGLGLAKSYLEAGCQVVAACRNPEKMKMLSGGTTSSLSKVPTVRVSDNEDVVPPVDGGLLITLQMDVGDQGTIESAVALLKGQGVVLDLVINNAGICPLENMGEWTAEAFAQTFSINATAPALVAQALAPLMKSGSKMVNMTSGMGSLELNLNPREGLDGYAMSKAALNILTRRLATRLEEDGISVFAISPGWVQTDMGGEAAPVGVDVAAPQIMNTIEGLTPEQNGGFFSESGEVIPW